MKTRFIKRHLAKTITWRIIGTLDTIIISWFISGSSFIGLQIGLVEVITKMILYYFHERAWFKSKIENSNKKHLLKTITWRIIGTLDTILLSWFITDNAVTGLQIGFLEVISKMLLYYLHERTWHKTSYGIEEDDK